MGVMTAERIKLTSTRSPWWCSAVVVVLSLGLAALFAVVFRATSDSEGAPDLSVDLSVSGVTGFGVMVLMIMATLTVTSEYRFGIIRTTFQATPNRSKVIATKALLVGLYAAVLTLVLALLSYALSKGIAGASAPSLELSSGDNWRAIYGVPIYAFLGVVLAIGVGVLVRQSAAAITLIVLWPLLIEGLLGAFGSFGRNVTPFLPFANASRFYSSGVSGPGNWHWGPLGSMVYFAAFVAIVFGIGLVVANKRDA